MPNHYGLLSVPYLPKVNVKIGCYHSKYDPHIHTHISRRSDTTSVNLQLRFSIFRCITALESIKKTQFISQYDTPK